MMEPAIVNRYYWVRHTYCNSTSVVVCRLSGKKSPQDTGRKVEIPSGTTLNGRGLLIVTVEPVGRIFGV